MVTTSLRLPLAIRVAVRDASAASACQCPGRACHGVHCQCPRPGGGPVSHVHWQPSLSLRASQAHGDRGAGPFKLVHWPGQSVADPLPVATSTSLPVSTYYDSTSNDSEVRVCVP